jgi:hypothetical protein
VSPDIKEASGLHEPPEAFYVNRGQIYRLRDELLNGNIFDTVMEAAVRIKRLVVQLQAHTATQFAELLAAFIGGRSRVRHQLTAS